MVGRRGMNEEAHALAIHTDLRRQDKGKGLAREHGVEHSALRAMTGRPTSTSLSSENGVEEEEEQIHTHLSASSAGNTDISSASAASAHSTAYTSIMADDDDDDYRSGPAPRAHPTLTILELVTHTASASALPNSFDFNVSRKGNFVAIYSASNIWLIKTVQLPRLWARTLQVKRKPVAVDVTEDGFLLAVLSKPTQVDVYEIHSQAQDRRIEKRRTIMLVHEANTVVISPDGLILIANNSIGIEVLAIGPDAPETARRTLSGPVGDVLEFSDCGRTLLLTSHARKSGNSSLYVLPGLYDGPFDEEGVPIPPAPATVWTDSMLFPETAKIARQATIIPDTATGQVNELFAFNSQEDTWGVYDIGSQRFTQRKMFLPDQQRWTRAEFLDDAMPAVSPNADLAAVALRMRGTTSIWIYQVPDWDSRAHNKPDQAPVQPCFCIPIANDGSDSVQDISTLRWVALNDHVQRLVAVGNSSMATTDEVPGAPGGSKGVILVLDFDDSKSVDSPTPIPTKTVYDLDPLCPGDLLPEGSIDFEREVELVRRRTMVQRRAQPGTQAHSRAGSTPTHPASRANRRHQQQQQQQPPTVSVRQPGAADEEELTAEEVQAAFEVPYDMQQPRSQASLLRAATVAAVSPANRRHLRALPSRPLEYWRADGLRELPHESDADNWVPPPPPYTTTAEASQSVSLSHPNGAPVPSGTPGPSSSAGPSSIPPVPVIPANISISQIPPSHPYRNRIGSLQSQSSTDLPRPTNQTQTTPQQDNRHPSLVHPATFPSPDQLVSSRRRSSAASRSPRQTQPIPPVPALPNQSAYHTTRALYSAASAASPPRPNTRPEVSARRALESGFNLRPPPILNPVTGRRGSAPESHHSRPPSAPLSGASANRVSMPASPHAPRTRERRTMLLPRLTTRGDGLGRGQAQQTVTGPVSAPPRTDSRTVGRYREEVQHHSRSASRLEGWLMGSDKDASPRKKPSCAVM